MDTGHAYTPKSAKSTFKILKLNLIVSNLRKYFHLRNCK